MDIFIAFVVSVFCIVLFSLLYRWEIKRYKAYIAREEEQTTMYKKISRKLDDM